MPNTTDGSSKAMFRKLQAPLIRIVDSLSAIEEIVAVYQHPMDVSALVPIIQNCQSFVKILSSLACPALRVMNGELPSLSKDLSSRPSVLSHRQGEVSTMLCKGWTNKEIALGLGISPATVKRHVESIYAKLGVHDRIGLYTKFNSDSGESL